ncbi:MAG: DUF86 domain-containing protein [bacterium]|nr:DUF86 domain-containing protein [bacterium]
MKNDSVYINQMLESVGKIGSFTKGLNRDGFFSDAKTQSAVIMQLLLIGEISKKVSEKTKGAIDLPWKDIAGFRDRAIHNYFEIDLDVVWNTLLSDIPELRSKLEKER